MKITRTLAIVAAAFCAVTVIPSCDSAEDLIVDLAKDRACPATADYPVKIQADSGVTTVISFGGGAFRGLNVGGYDVPVASATYVPTGEVHSDLTDKVKVTLNFDADSVDFDGNGTYDNVSDFSITITLSNYHSSAELDAVNAEPDAQDWAQRSFQATKGTGSIKFVGF